MAETTLNKKMRAFDDEVALTVAPFYLIHMLQRTFPIFISDKVTLHISREKDDPPPLKWSDLRYVLDIQEDLKRSLRSYGKLPAPLYERENTGATEATMQRLPCSVACQTGKCLLARK